MTAIEVGPFGGRVEPYLIGISHDAGGPGATAFALIETCLIGISRDADESAPAFTMLGCVDRKAPVSTTAEGGGTDYECNRLGTGLKLPLVAAAEAEKTVACPQ